MIVNMISKSGLGGKLGGEKGCQHIISKDTFVL